MEVHMSKWARAANRRGRKPGDFKMIPGVTHGGPDIPIKSGAMMALMHREATYSTAAAIELEGKRRHEAASIIQKLIAAALPPLNEPSTPRIIPQLVAEVKEEVKAQPDERVNWATAAAMMRAGEIMKCNDGYFCKMVGDELFTKPANWNPETSWNGPMSHGIWKYSTFEVVS
jgi:hypothetical protein